jgi:cytochrome c553
MRHLAAILMFVSAICARGGESLPPDHAAQMAKGVALFNSDVAKLLVDNCVKCHGGEKGVKGELDITTREALLKGGESGDAIVPGKSAESLLVKTIRHEDKDLKMPKKADKLGDAAISKIAEWIDLGAPYARPLVEGKSRDRSVVTEDDRKWWAFQPLAEVSPPRIENSGLKIGNPIDAFIFAKLIEKGITPTPAAEKRTLIRRAYFDLIGLPPTPEQVDQFLHDSSPDAYEKLVDGLLASPHHGERWGRHWLDLARYAESHGYEQDYDRPNAWHYRDYVIRALNADQPFDEFVRWQIAGDELAPDDPEAWKATGFLAAGTHATQITANQAEKERYDELDDMAATIGTAMLGLTVGCARCHDHKYDPIPTRDYYRLVSTFTKTVRSDYDVIVNAAQYRAEKDRWSQTHAGPPLQPATVRALVCSEGVPAVRLHTQGPDFYEQTFFLSRGDLNKKQGEAPQGFLQVLMRAPEERWLAPAPANARTTWRRASLAKWLADKDAGAGHLLARVIVNRLWQHHFGRGIVATPSDFGAQGEKPTHPELLDFLAGELIRGGWKLKPLHKLMMTSATYMEGAGRDAARSRADPNDTLFWRHPRQRLEGEIIRDAILATTGTLDGKMFGPGTLNPAMRRRSIYFQIKRSQLPPMMVTFDAPDTLTGAGLRPSTTVAPQALLLMNNEHVRTAARVWAKALAALPAEAAIQRAYRAALGREPAADEAQIASQFLKTQTDSYGAKKDAVELALTDFCQSMLSLNEFIYVE